jgi:DNA-directed RNA polymerase specialized sigma24 family protein
MPMTGPDWEAWLASPECLGPLERAARAVLRQARHIGLPEGLLPCEGLGALSGPGYVDCVQATAHDLWVFLSTRPASWRRRSDLAWLAGQGESFLARRIGQDYLQHLKDQARTYGSHPWRALYRRVRQVLREEPSIHTRATDRGVFYSLEPGSPDWVDPHRLGATPYEAWSSPLDAVPAADLHRRESLVRLATIFWHQAVHRLGDVPRALPVRELVHYLSRHYGHLSPPARVVPGKAVGGDEADGVEGVPQPGGEVGPELAVVRSRLAELARKLVASWPDRLRTAFVLIQGEELTLEEAARRMGYKGPSGASYAYRSALERLRDFCLLWPGLSPPDLDENLFDELVSLVLDLCRRDSQGREP